MHVITECGSHISSYKYHNVCNISITDINEMKKKDSACSSPPPPCNTDNRRKIITFHFKN